MPPAPGVSKTRRGSLRDLLAQPSTTLPIHHRHLPATPAAAITETVDRAAALVWYQGAFGQLRAMLAAQCLDPAGPAAGIFADELFADERGEATIFLPCTQAVRPMGRVAPVVVHLLRPRHAGPRTAGRMSLKRRRDSQPG